MPLFMDFHKGLHASAEEVKKAHITDEAVQSKYGVIYHQFWVIKAKYDPENIFCINQNIKPR